MTLRWTWWYRPVGWRLFGWAYFVWRWWEKGLCQLLTCSQSSVYMATVLHILALVNAMCYTWLRSTSLCPRPPHTRGRKSKASSQSVTLDPSSQWYRCLSASSIGTLDPPYLVLCHFHKFGTSFSRQFRVGWRDTWCISLSAPALCRRRIQCKKRLILGAQLGDRG